nr:hypothetical protein CFP56_46773 [Quercus suber]
MSRLITSETVHYRKAKHVLVLESFKHRRYIRIRDQSWVRETAIWLPQTQADEDNLALLWTVIHNPGHLDRYKEKLRYLKSRAGLWNKLLGRPATSETAILVPMVSRLLEATQIGLGDNHAIIAAVLSTPDHINLTGEEIGDIYDYLDLKNLMTGTHSLLEVYATSAAFADLNLESLSGTIQSLPTASVGSVDASFVDLDLGLGSTASDGGDGAEYWTGVSDRIRELVRSFHRVCLPHVIRILLTGPRATNARFRAAVRAALHNLRKLGVAFQLRDCSRSSRDGEA